MKAMSLIVVCGLMGWMGSAFANPLTGMADSAFQSKKDAILSSLKSCISPATNEQQLKQCLLSQLNPLSGSSAPAANPLAGGAAGAASQLMQNPGSALQGLGGGL